MMNKKTDKKTVVVGALALLLGSSLTALAGTDNRAPEVPFQIAVDPGNKVQFHGFGVGFQVYNGMARIGAELCPTRRCSLATPP